MYRLRCFGTMGLEDGGDAEFTLRSRKHWALLVYLLAHRGRAFPRERLARLFWDTEPRLARHSLSQALYDIRTTLPGVEFDSSTSQVGAGAEELAYDGEAFEEAVRSDDLGRAVRLYGGRFAPDVEDAGNSDFTRWLESERQRYRRLAEMALYRHVRESHDRADWGEMCVSALRLLDMNPLGEDAHRALMRGLWLQGDRAAAVRHFEEVEDYLERELPGGIGRETIELVERIRENRPSAAPGPDGDDRRREMVGREEEFAVLRRRLEELREDGRGGVVRVHGEAGMGKTRLLEEFRSLVELDGVRVLESRCYAAESDVPYGPVVEALDGIAGEVSGAAGSDGDLTYHQLGHLFPDAFDRPVESRDAFAEPDAGRRRLYEEVADLLRRVAGEEPVVWLMEDVHWIDPSSASLLHYLARRLADGPVLLVVTARTHEQTTGPARELLEDDSGSFPDVADVELEPLERGETEELVASVTDEDPEPEAVDRIHVLAGGNPFYALELLRASSSLEEEDVRDVLEDGTRELITENLRTLLERRLRGLPEDAARIMETVAVAGRHATSALVREVTDFPPARIADLAGTLYERGLLRDVDGRLEFLHDITREFVYGDLGDLQRSALHLSVGELLDRREGAADPATLARHFQEGDEPRRADRYALDAARDAERRHAHDEAIQMGEMALELASGETEEAEALWVLGRAEYSALEFSAAREHLENLAEHHVGEDSEYPVEEAYFLLAKIAIELSQWTEANEWLHKAEQEVTRNGTLKQELKCLHLQLKVSLKASNRDDARRIKDKMGQLVQSLEYSSDYAESVALVAISVAAYDFYCESSETALKRLETVEDIAEVPLSTQLTFLQLKGGTEQRSGKFERSRGTHRRSLQLASEYNDIVGQLTAVNNLMCVCLERGRMERALEYYDSVHDIMQLAPRDSEAWVSLQLNRAESLFALERYRAAIQVYRRLNQWLRTQADGFADVGVPVHTGLGLCLLATQNRGEATDIFRSMSAGDWKGGGVPTGDLYPWFIGYMKWQRDPTAAHDFMVEQGQSQLAHQEVAGRRILWLARLFKEYLGASSGRRNIDDLYRTEVADRLRQVENGWFLRFSKRWLRAATHIEQRTSALRHG